MDESGIIMLGVVLFVFALLWALKSSADSKQKVEDRKTTLEEKVDNLVDFTPTQKIIGAMNMYVFAVDHDRRKIAYINEKEVVFVPYEKIISVEVVENNTIIASKSSVRTIGGAVVGGALAGGAGAIVGGLSGDSEMKKKISLVQVRIKMRDINSPVLLINCFDSDAMAGYKDIAPDSDRIGIEHARKISDLVSIIIDDVDRAEKQSLASGSTTAVASVAEELAKLADLRSKGLLTDEEFDKQKVKLLNQ